MTEKTEQQYASEMVRGEYGATLLVSVPGTDKRVEISQDVYGERRRMMQLLVYEAEPERPGNLDGEPVVSIRFRDDGTVAEVAVKDRGLVRGTEDWSPWMDERDGPFRGCCVAPDTEVALSDGSFKKVSELEPGDAVQRLHCDNNDIN